MAIEYTTALTAEINAALSAAVVKFPSDSLEWGWTETAEGRVRFFAEFEDADNALRLVIELGTKAGPSLDYEDAAFYLEETRTQGKTFYVQLPPPSDVELAGFTSFAPVLQYVADWRDRLAGP